MGNCALKPKVLSEAGAPAPEVFNDSLLEEQKIEAVKSLRYLLLQDKQEKKTEDDEKTPLEKTTVDRSPVAETKPPVTQDKEDKKTEEDEKITPEKTQVTEDLKTYLPEEKSPTQSPVMETKLPVKEEAVREAKVIDDELVKEIETEVVGREEAQ